MHHKFILILEFKFRTRKFWFNVFYLTTASVFGNNKNPSSQQHHMIASLLYSTVHMQHRSNTDTAKMLTKPTNKKNQKQFVMNFVLKAYLTKIIQLNDCAIKSLKRGPHWVMTSSIWCAICFVLLSVFLQISFLIWCSIIMWRSNLILIIPPIGIG